MNYGGRNKPHMNRSGLKKAKLNFKTFA
jgi:hypothetical protein